MKACPFCGSPAVAWPEYASDYVRGYSLCEFHMRGALKMATVSEYDEQRVKNENKRVKYESQVWNLILSWANKIEPTFSDNPDAFPVLHDVFKRAVENISFLPRPDYGEPVKISIDDTKIDRWFTVRISDLAKKRKKYRCDAERPGQADGRCTNYRTNADGFCDTCRTSSSKITRAIRSTDRISRIMEMLKND